MTSELLEKIERLRNQYGRHSYLSDSSARNEPTATICDILEELAKRDTPTAAAEDYSEAHELLMSLGCSLNTIGAPAVSHIRLVREYYYRHKGG